MSMSKRPTVYNEPSSESLGFVASPVTATDSDTFLDHLSLDSTLLSENADLVKVNEQISHMVKCIRDRVNEEQNSLTQLSTVIDEMVEPLVAVLADGTIIEFNHAAEELFGYDYSEVIGKSVEILMPEAYRASHACNIKKFIDREIPVIKRREVVGLTKVGKEIPLEISVTLYERAKVKYLYTFIRDITERKRYEQELKKKSQILEAVSYAGRKLLLSYQDNISKVLARLGTAADVSRVYLFLKSQSDELFKFKKEWCALGVTPLLEDFNKLSLSNIFDKTKDWVEAFSQFKPVKCNVIDIKNDSLRMFLVNKLVRSLLLVPIFVDGKWKGFIGFDECRNQRTWTEDEVEALKGAAGSIAAAIERHLRDESLRVTVKFERQLLDMIPNPVFVKDKQGRYVKVNQAFLNAIGLSESEVIGNTALDLFPNEFSAFYQATDKRVFTTKQVHNYRGDLPSVTGQSFKGMYYKAPLTDHQSNIFGLIGTFVDLTAQFRYEEEISTKNNILGAIFRASALLFRNEWKDNIIETLMLFCEAIKAQGSAIFKCTDNRVERLYTWNRTFTNLPLPDSLVNISIDDFISPTICAESQIHGLYYGDCQSMTTLFSTQVAKLFSIKSLCYLPIVVNAEVWGYIVYGFLSETKDCASDTVISSLRLVSELFSIALERDHYLTVLKDSKENYQRLFNSFPEGYLVHSGDEILFCNQTLLTRIGEPTLESMRHRTVSSLLIANNVIDFWNWLRTKSYQAKPLELSLKTNTGMLIPVEFTCFESEYNCKPVHQTFVRDMSFRQTERLLKAAVYRALNESSDIIILTDAEGTIIFANTTFEQHYQYSLSEVIGKNPRILNSGVHERIFFQELWETVLSGNPWEGMIVNRKKDGTLSWDYTYITPIMNGTTKPIYLLAMKKIDVKQRHKLTIFAKDSDNQDLVDKKLPNPETD